MINDDRPNENHQFGFVVAIILITEQRTDKRDAGKKRNSARIFTDFVLHQTAHHGDVTAGNFQYGFHFPHLNNRNFTDDTGFGNGRVGVTLLADDPATPVEARYWFVRDTPRFIDLTLDAELEHRYATALQTLVRSIATGLFPAKPPAAPSYGYIQCPYCDPDGMGVSDLRRDWERKRHDPAVAPYADLAEPPEEAAAP